MPVRRVPRDTIECSTAVKDACPYLVSKKSSQMSPSLKADPSLETAGGITEESREKVFSFADGDGSQVSSQKRGEIFSFADGNASQDLSQMPSLSEADPGLQAAGTIADGSGGKVFSFADGDASQVPPQMREKILSFDDVDASQLVSQLRDKLFSFADGNASRELSETPSFSEADSSLKTAGAITDQCRGKVFSFADGDASQVPSQMQEKTFSFAEGDASQLASQMRENIFSFADGNPSWATSRLPTLLEAKLSLKKAGVTTDQPQEKIFSFASVDASQVPSQMPSFIEADDLSDEEACAITGASQEKMVALVKDNCALELDEDLLTTCDSCTEDSGQRVCLRSCPPKGWRARALS